MSVLIKGINMPKGEEEGLFIAIYDGKAYRVGTKEELEAVEIPTPHGRLIDAERLTYSFNVSDFDNSDAFENVDSAIHVVNCMPTVIEAEE